MSDIYNRVGELTGTVRSMQESLTEVKTAISRIREEQQKLWDVTRRIEDIEEEIISLKAALEAIEAPVEQFVGLKKRMMSIIGVGFGVVAVIWALAEPIYTFIVGRLLGGSH